MTHVEAALHDLFCKPSRRVSNAAAQLQSVLLFLGPPGVGKTELAKAIGAHLQRGFIHISLNQTPHLTALVGGSPQHVGFTEGGLLTNGLLKHPNAVVLLDECGKSA